MSNSTYEVHHKKDKDFKTVEMHSHDFSEIYFFLQGSASYIVEDCKYSLRRRRAVDSSQQTSSA